MTVQGRHRRPPSAWFRLLSRAVAALAVLLAAGDRPGAAALDEEWLPVRDTSLTIKRGSPLDFSFLPGVGIAGEKGRVTAGADGSLHFERSPEEPLRFLCAALAWSPASGSYPDHATADLYAEQLKLHGYNVARLHFVDANLMTDRDRDFDFDPTQLDRFRYLLSALKRNGIHWMIDAATSENGAYGGVYPDRWQARHDLKVQVHLSEEARRHWLRLASAILGSVNPYTGSRPLDDPALAIVTLFNENGLEFSSYLYESRTGRAYPDALAQPFNDWLAANYRSTEALRKAWGILGTGESVELRTIDLPSRHGARGARMRDLQRFFHAREAETALWMTAALRQLGYQGLITGYNNMGTTAAHLSRRELPLVSLDSYHDEVLSLAPKTSIKQTSSLDDDAGYVQSMMAARWEGRPFIVSEYDHLFWNRFRHEAGAVVPAYAALQGWSGICRHGWGPIDLAYGSPFPHKQRMMPYGLGLDPIARASETLAALLYRRGDVAASRQRLLVPFASESDLIADGQGEIPRDLTRLGLISRIGLSDAPVNDGSRLTPMQTDTGSRLPRWLDRIAGKIAGTEARAFDERLDRLAAAGIIAPGTVALAKSRVYRSDTGEITLDSARRMFSLVTSATEAVTFERLADPLKLGKVSVLAANVPALVAVSTLDGRPLASSRKLLIILSTDALNTGMTFTDTSRRTVTDYGSLPVRLRRAVVRLELALEAPEAGRPERPRLSSLRLDGTIGDTSAVNRSGKAMTLNIDTAAPSHGPTTFFLLER